MSILKLKLSPNSISHLLLSDYILAFLSFFFFFSFSLFFFLFTYPYIIYILCVLLFLIIWPYQWHNPWKLYLPIIHYQQTRPVSLQSTFTLQPKWWWSLSGLLPLSFYEYLADLGFSPFIIILLLLMDCEIQLFLLIFILHLSCHTFSFGLLCYYPIYHYAYHTCKRDCHSDLGCPRWVWLGEQTYFLLVTTGFPDWTHFFNGG